MTDVQPPSSSQMRRHAVYRAVLQTVQAAANETLIDELSRTHSQAQCEEIAERLRSRVATRLVIDDELNDLLDDGSLVVDGRPNGRAMIAALEDHAQTMDHPGSQESLRHLITYMRNILRDLDLYRSRHAG